MLLPKRAHEIKVRFDEDEYQDLMKKVNQSCMSREKFIRHCIKKTNIKTPPTIDFYHWIIECNAIGNNLNQIARKLNSNESVQYDYCIETLNNLNTLVNKMDLELRGK